jgi:hypothetical protein
VLLPRRHDVPMERNVGDHRLAVLLRGVVAEVAEEAVGLFEVGTGYGTLVEK